jgi:hypothetical protein
MGEQIFILYPGSRKDTAFSRPIPKLDGRFAPQGRYSETAVFAREAPQFLEKNKTFLKIAFKF